MDVRTVYLCDCGWLLKPDNEDFDGYNEVYDKCHSFFDEDLFYFEDKDKALKYAREFAEKGEGGYAVISESTLNEDKIERMEDSDSGMLKNPVEKKETYSTDDIIYCVANIDGEIREDFMKVLKYGMDSYRSLPMAELSSEGYRLGGTHCDFIFRDGIAGIQKGKDEVAFIEFDMENGEPVGWNGNFLFLIGNGRPSYERYAHPKAVSLTEEELKNLAILMREIYEDKGRPNTYEMREFDRGIYTHNISFAGNCKKVSMLFPTMGEEKPCLEMEFNLSDEDYNEASINRHCPSGEELSGITQGVVARCCERYEDGTPSVKAFAFTGEKMKEIELTLKERVQIRSEVEKVLSDKNHILTALVGDILDGKEGLIERAESVDALKESPVCEERQTIANEEKEIADMERRTFVYVFDDLGGLVTGTVKNPDDVSSFIKELCEEMKAGYAMTVASFGHDGELALYIAKDEENEYYREEDNDFVKVSAYWMDEELTRRYLSGEEWEDCVVYPDRIGILERAGVLMNETRISISEGLLDELEGMMERLDRLGQVQEKDENARPTTLEYDEESGEYYSRPADEFDGIDPQTYTSNEEPERD